MQEPLPPFIDGFKEKHPAVWDAFAKLGDACHHTGPLDEKTRRLVKLALSIALRHEGGVHSATRRALESGVTQDEMEQVALLAITTIGWPSASAAGTWIADECAGQTAAEER
jgi:alkylhydroperoxidase/carboxymuconolactone decarboxylase family protein YurZ